MGKQKWTLEWTFKYHDGHTELGYPQEYWNGGFMMWGKIPAEGFLFDSEKELKDFISEYLWDKDDPMNKSFRIVQYECDGVFLHR